MYPGTVLGTGDKMMMNKIDEAQGLMEFTVLQRQDRNTRDYEPKRQDSSHEIYNFTGRLITSVADWTW